MLTPFSGPAITGCGHLQNPRNTRVSFALITPKGIQAESLQSELRQRAGSDCEIFQWRYVAVHWQH